MILFLTSSPTGPLDNSRPVEGLDEMNGFRERLGRYWKEYSNCLIISASPEDCDSNDEMQAFFADAFMKSGFSISTVDVWDVRTEDFSKETLFSYDVIILGGGHVPTQNAFFKAINLRRKIHGYHGIVMGISAGTMNSADMVYAQPEMPGEAIDPGYVRFFKGLGLTKRNILPHYQMVKDWELDGMRLYEDITYGDSHGNEFYVLEDGSYLLAVDGKERIYGNAYLIIDGKCHKICGEDEMVQL